MSLFTYLKDAFILLSVFGLLSGGFLIAIRSEPGTSVAAKGSGLLRTVFAVSCILMVLMMAQGAVGFRVGSRW